ncbi:MAG: DUF4129 domain-containing protein [Chloroflexota bacterium]|nr:DUF4129 domain-containing protein [Chloroflexota bacterium]
MSVGSMLGSQWLGNRGLQRVLVCGMYACVAAALWQLLLRAGASEAQAVATTLASFVTFVAGILLGGRSTSQPYRPAGNLGPRDWLLLLVPIMLLLRFLPYVGLGGEQLASDMTQWRTNPTSFFDFSLIGSAVVLVGVWMYALAVARNLELLSLQPGELPPTAGTVEYHDWLESPYRYVDHAGAWQGLMGRFLGGGVILMLILGVAELGPNLLIPDRPLRTDPMLLLLLYFLLGLVLAAQTGLDRLRADWIRSGAAVQPGMIPRWLVAGTMLMLCGLALALLLPTTLAEDAVESLPLLGQLLSPIFSLVKLILSGLAWLFSNLLALLLSPLTWFLPDAQLPIPEPELASQETIEQGQGEAIEAGSLEQEQSWFNIIWRLLTFGIPGAIAGVIALYALWNAWRKRGEIRGLLADAWSEAVGSLRDAFAIFIAWVWRAAGSLAPRRRRRVRVRAKRRGQPQEGTADLDFHELGRRALNRLAPRQLLIYFYLSMLAWAAKLGWGRQESDTAYEASTQLARHLPQQREPITSLTEAFVRARYSPAAVSRDEAALLRQPWDRVRGVLQQKRRFQWLAFWRR